MIQHINKDPILLSRKSLPATVNDLKTAQDLVDTLNAHREECVGMAANMIGALLRIIVFDKNGEIVLMFNPEIIKSAIQYEAEEGCLSLIGLRKVRRFRTIKVQYQNASFEKRINTYTGWTAQVIQHEIDHLNGILI